MTKQTAPKFVSNNKDRVGIGIIAVEAGVMSFVFQDLAMKSLGVDMSVWQLQVLRSLIGLVPLAIGAYFIVGKVAFVIHNWRLHLFRGILGFTGYSTFYVGLMQLPVAEAGALFYTSPIIITALSSIVLKERLGIYRICAVIVGFAGILVMLRPGFSVFSWASILPLYSAFAYAVTMVVVRHFRSTETATGLAIYVNVSYILYASAGSVLAHWLVSDPSIDSIFYPVLRDWSAVQAGQIPFLICLGLAGICGHLLMTFAYKTAPASTIAPFDYTYVALIVIGGFLFWDEVPDAYTLLGIVMIVGSGVFIAIRESIRARRDGARKLTANRVILPSIVPFTKRRNEERAPSEQLPD